MIENLEVLLESLFTPLQLKIEWINVEMFAIKLTFKGSKF